MKESRGNIRKQKVMAKAKIKTPSTSILTIDSIKAMSQPDRIVTFVFEANAGQRAFSAMGRLLPVIEDNLPKGEKLFPTLIAAGVKKGTISNATYAAKVYGMVTLGKLTEAEYETLCFTECVAICQVQTEKAKKRLTADEVVAAIRSGGDFEADLKSLFDLGMTADEKAAAEASVKAKKAAADAETAAKAEEQKLETERLLAENAALKAASAALAADAPVAAPAVAAPAVAAPVAAPAVAAPAVAAPAVAAPAVAAPVVADVALSDILALLNEVEASIQTLSAQDQIVIASRLAEMAEMFAVA
jgi:hypothetical protein